MDDQELLLDEKILGEYRLDAARTEQFGQGGQQMNQQKQERPHGPDATGCARRGKTAKSLRVMIRNDNSPGTGYYDPATKVFAGSVRGEITTVINNATPQYIRNLMSARP